MSQAHRTRAPACRCISIRERAPKEKMQLEDETDCVWDNNSEGLAKESDLISEML